MNKDGIFGLSTETTTRISIALILTITIISQLSTWILGLNSLGADDSARILLAWETTPSKVMEPFFWPPLTRLLHSLGLLVYDDLMVGPQLVTQILSFSLVGAVAFLAHRLFDSKIIVLISAAFCAVISHRVVFATAPMSDSLFNPLMIMAIAYFVGVARDLNKRDTILTSVFLALACMVRYEAWFISMTFGLFLAWKCLIRRELSFSILVGSGLIVSLFPIYWVGGALLSEDGMSAISVTSAQAEALGATLFTFVRNSHVFALAEDVLLTPLIVALVPIVLFAITDKDKRIWIGGLIVAFIVVVVFILASGSVSYAIPWRFSGVWTLSMLPFLAFWIVSMANQAPSANRPWVILGAITVVVAALSFQTLYRWADRVKYRSYSDGDIIAGQYLRDWFEDQDGNILIESTGSYNFLNLLVTSNAPERAALSTGDDIQMVALHIAQSDYLQKNQPEIYRSYASPKYDLASGGNLEKITERDIKLVVVESEAIVEALNLSPNFERAEQFGKWTIFQLTYRSAYIDAFSGNDATKLN